MDNTTDKLVKGVLIAAGSYALFYATVKIIEHFSKKTIVINANGTDRFKAKSKGYKSWNAYYRDNLGIHPHKKIKCQRLGCENLAEDGSHILKIGKNRKMYIVLLCKSCNQIKNTKFEIKGDLVPVRNLA